jgi:signal transduction histidine kinase
MSSEAAFTGGEGATQFQHRILFVDDDRAVLKSLKRLFHGEGLEVMTAENSAQALELLRRYPVQLVVSDQRMPGANGVEFLSQVRDRYPEVVRVLLTGYADLDAASGAINRGQVFRFLQKPWDDNDLRDAVYRALAYHDLRRENRRLLELTGRQNLELRELNSNLEAMVRERTQELEDSVAQYRQANARLSQAQGQLIQSQKMASLGLLAAGMAHELNNPLSAVLAYTQILLQELPPGQTAEADLHEIEEAAFRCKKIVEDLRLFSRQSRSHENQPLDLNEVIESALRLVTHPFSLQKIQIERDLEKELPRMGGSRNRLQSVFLNLFTNAQAAMPAGGSLRLKTRTRRKEGQLEAVVADTGVGIPAENLPRIFDPFFTTKPEGQGTGLGLSVTYGIVQEHGGTIAVESQVGRGARFTLRFPAATLRLNPKAPPDASAEPDDRPRCEEDPDAPPPLPQAA